MWRFSLIYRNIDSYEYVIYILFIFLGTSLKVLI